jgi:hypothetical protein
LPVHLNWQRPPSLPRKLRSWRRDVCRLIYSEPYPVLGHPAEEWPVHKLQAMSGKIATLHPQLHYSLILKITIQIGHWGWIMVWACRGGTRLGCEVKLMSYSLVAGLFSGIDIRYIRFSQTARIQPLSQSNSRLPAPTFQTFEYV